MKAKRIDLSPFEVEIPNSDGVKMKVPYDFRNSMADIILAPQLRLNGSALMKNWRIAEKIQACKEDHILLTYEEYNILRGATEQIDVFSKNDVELIKRIQEAPDVEVEEKK